MEKFANTICLVTGASAGIGKALCLRLLTESPNVTVVGLARRPIAIDHANFCGLLCDISKAAEIDRTVSVLRSKFPGRRVSILVNNAGHAKPLPLLSDAALVEPGTVVPESLQQTSDIYRSMLDTNVLGLALSTRAFSQLMDHAQCGNIVNINSMSGHRVVQSVNTHFYSATKYAVTALTEGTRQELRRLNSKVRANQISPGFVDTEFFGAVSQDAEYLSKMEKIAAIALTADDIVDAILLCVKAAPACQVGDVQLRPTVQVS